MHPALILHRGSRSRRRAQAGAVLAVLALVLAACSGSSSDGTADPSTTATETGASDATTTTATDGSVDGEADPSAAPAGGMATGEAVPSSGCGTSTVGQVDEEQIPLGDAERYYLQTTPPEHDGVTPLPLVLDFHGLLEGAPVHARMTQMGPFAAEHGFVAVFPHGTGNPIGWNTGVDRTGNPDLVYVDALLDQVEQDLCIDTSRVFATGLSNGAFISSTLACVMPDRIAAVAPVAGLQLPEPCAADRPVPILTFHGTADPILLFNGGVGERLTSIMDGTSDEAPLPPVDLDGDGYPAAARGWAERNGCEPEPVEEALTDTVTERTWTCPAAGAVQFDIVDGGGHTWPGSEFSKPLASIMGATDDTLDANEAIWSFFQRFQLPAT